MPRLLASLSLLLLAAGFSSRGEEVKFTGSEARYGLNMQQTASVCRDGDGFLWTANVAGAVRLTESAYRRYTLPYKAPNVQYVRVMQVTKGEDGNELWAYTNNGQCFRYNRVADAFDLAMDLRDSLGNANLSLGYAVADRAGRLWLPTTEGLYCLPPKEGGLRKMRDRLPGFVPAVVVEESDSTLLVVNYPEICRIRGGDRVETIGRIPTDFVPVSAYWDAPGGRLWIGTRSDGLWILEPDGNACPRRRVRAPISGVVNAIRAYSPDELIVGADGEGLWLVDLDDESARIFSQEDPDDPDALNSNGVYDVLVEPGRLWVATWSRGLSLYERRETGAAWLRHIPNQPQSLANDVVNKVLEDSRGRLWLATEGGLSRYDRAADRWTHFLPKTVCMTLFEDSAGRIWVGTFGSGAMALDPDSGRVLLRLPSDLGRADSDPRYIMDIVEDSEQRLWVTGIRCLAYLDSQGTCFTALEPKAIRRAHALPDGDLLLACAHALTRLDRRTGLQRDLVPGLMQDLTVRDGIAWVAAAGQGILRYDIATGESRYITESEGLPSNFVNALLLAEDALWAGTALGICRIDPESGAVTIFPASPDLSRTLCNVSSASLSPGGGELMWGTNGGAFLFAPDALPEQPYNGALYIQDVFFSGKSVRSYPAWNRGLPVDAIDRYRVHYAENTLTMDFLPLRIPDRQVRFSWKLDGMDREWSPPASSRNLHYANIPVGRHFLHLRMTSGRSDEVLDERTLEIRVLPPFWRTWWFLLAAGLLAVYLICVSLGYYTVRLKQRVVPILDISRTVERHADLPDRETSADPFVQKAIRVVYDNMLNPDFDKDYFAREMCVSPSLLYKRLKALTDQSPVEFIRILRMERALALLREHRHSIAEVSECCGFSSPGYFSTVFRQFYGKSPSDI